jgi:hypothetical protein
LSANFLLTDDLAIPLLGEEVALGIELPVLGAADDGSRQQDSDEF